MHVDVDFFGPFRDAVGQKTLTFEMPDGATVGDALDAAAERHPSLADLLFDETGALAESMTVTHNGQAIQLRDGVETGLADGDTLRVTSPIHGG